LPESVREAFWVALRSGLSISQVVEKVGVSRQTLHAWLARYEAQGLEGLVDRSHRPVSCPHQMPAQVEAAVLELRRSRPYWGPRRLVFELAKRKVAPVPSGSAVYRALLRAAMIDPALRDRRSRKWKRWERGAPMELWQMDVVGGFPLADGTSAKALTGVDDHSRMCVCARLMSRERTRAVCDGLRAALGAFDGCKLKQTATQLVFADGRPGARVMLVGEAPGREEDLQGLPFVGRSGQLLDRMLAAIGLDRNTVYIANVVPWRPPGNRTPTPQETATCRPFIERQIELCDPDFLICMGAPAAAELMGNRDGILKFRGRWQQFDTGSRKVRAMATLHPAYLLRQPLQKRLAWRDFLTLKLALDAPKETTT